eukprot:TRINITY_DN20951_c0_g1_i1.p1 TRINITY_DN20951_c0_g1~~TRINITY_DN20951_c0_g1_i1.p1  ORF type:complete len:288 (+),score=92.92 TRINITY_DN20951_c0_g1_i1:57-866(+)
MAKVATETRVRRVILVVAMHEEADPFIKKHGLREVLPKPFHGGMPMEAYSGVVAGVEVCLVWTGRDERYKVNNVATTAAAVATYAALAAFGKVDMVMSAGTAGGFGHLGAQIGDVYISTKCVFHNRRIPVGSDYEEYGFGHFRSPPLPVLAREVGAKMGVVTTSDSLDFSPIDLELMRGEGASVKEMEAAAVAWVCQQARIPFVAVKSITDIVDGPVATQDEFYSNLRAASDALQVKLTAILGALGGRPLEHFSFSALRASASASASKL